MQQINFDRKTVNECLQQRFLLPTYQREYKWELKHLDDLLNDVQEAFMSAREPSHGRKDVLGYDPYFLGTIITTSVDQGDKAIVDGQQRITTLTLLLCYAHRQAKKCSEWGISPVDQAIRRRVAGANTFNLEMDQPRQQFFSRLVDGPLDDDELAIAIDAIPDKDAGTLQLWKLYQEIEPLLGSAMLSRELLPQFFDYLTECVLLVEISVPREQDGHKVFVTMNDRGSKLSPIDLLKGFLLSSIANNVENKKAHSSWNDFLRKLQDLGADEDSAFFKTWLRAKYATTIRGKRRGDPAADFELVGESYHRWVMDNKDRLTLNTSDDFCALINDSLPFYVELYCRIKTAERDFNDEYPHIYFNGARDLTLQAMVIISSVKESDGTEVVAKKLRVISYYLDYLATVRVLNNKENTYDNIRDQMFDIAKRLRNLSLQELKVQLNKLITSETDTLHTLQWATYNNLKKQDLLHLLARISSELEVGLDVSNAVGFATYVDRTRDSRTYDVEHLLPNSLDAVNTDLEKSNAEPYTSLQTFQRIRNKLGALILLPRSRNRSMKDMPYSDKLVRYATENVLAQTLTSPFFLNQPIWNRFAAETGVQLPTITDASEAAVEIRTAFYLGLGRRIWSQAKLDALFD